MIQGQDHSSKQIIQLTAEIQAIDDIFYYAKKAMKQKQISFLTFMKTITNYSNEQFDKISLLNKILKLQMEQGQR